LRLIFCLAALIMCSSPLYAQVYTWTDKAGTQHFTDDRGAIPAKYRNKAVALNRFDDTDDAPRPAKPQEPAATLETPKAEESTPTKRRTVKKSASEVDRLAATLMEKATTDRDKAYAAFAWVRANIYYDHATLWRQRYGKSGADQSPEGVLAAKSGVCLGMANLFAALTDRMGLKSAVVVGIAAGMRQEAHAWNAVMVDGAWGLVDVTRHSFLNPPQDFIAHHFPNNAQWQLLEPPLTYAEWLKR